LNIGGWSSIISISIYEREASMGPSEWIALGELLVAIIGVIVGIIGGKEIKEANKLKIQFRDLKAKVEKIEVSNSQIAQTINNNGMGYRDTKDIAEDVVAEKTKNKPDVFYQNEKPKNYKAGDIWIH
jgi:predicted transcriptional regulator